MRGFPVRPSPWLLAPIAAATLSVGPGCPSTADDDEDDDDVEEVFETPASPIRRLGQTEWNNTVRDLFEVDTRAQYDFPVEFTIEGFENNAEVQASSALLVEAMREATVSVTQVALNQMIPDCKGNPDGQCARVFLTEFLPRAFRRPVTEEELSLYVDFWNAEEEATYFMAAYQLTVQAILQSPEFLFRVEFGAEEGEEGDRVPLTQHEIASRLSYFLWASMPDDALFADADAGRLDDPTVLAEHARRMLADPRAREAVTDFHRQWLDLNKVLSVEVDGTQTEFWNRNVRPDLREGTLRWLEWVVFDGPGTIEGLLTDDSAFANGNTAGIYNVAPPNGEWTRLQTPDRAGVLMDASWLAIHSHASNPSPVLRGKFISDRVLCNEVDPPPAGLTIFPPREEDFAGQTTNRERYERTTESAACIDCHEPMHGLGFPLEGFDMIGALRDTDRGLPIDESGEIIDADVEGPVSDRHDLVETLSRSTQVRRCYTKQWFRYGFGRIDRPGDGPVIDEVDAAVGAAGGDVQELLVAFVQTEAFRTRTVGEAN